MRIADDKEPWRPTWLVTVAAVVVAAAANLSDWYLGTASLIPWGSGLATGVALCALALRLEDTSEPH